MKILVAIPCLFDACVTEQAISSFHTTRPHINLLLIDNGADVHVKKVLNTFYPKALVNSIQNDKNIFVNPAWNQALQYFLEKSSSDVLCIANSDIIMHPQWAQVLVSHLNKNPDVILIPNIVPSMEQLKKEVDCSPYGDYLTEVNAGTPGVFIVLQRKYAEIVYPIPHEIKVWFGDNWIYDGFRAIGVPTVIAENLQCFHYGQRNVSVVKGISEIIEQDKKAWAELIEPNLKKTILLRKSLYES